jgi:hypothetical protein
MRIIRFSTTVAVLAVTATVLASATAATASVRPARLASQHWSQVTPNGQSNIADIGLARAGHGVLDVIWASGVDSAGHAAIEDTPIRASGAVGRAATVISGQELVTYPAATITKTSIDAVWNGIATNPGPDGSFISSRGLSGGSWPAPINVPPLGDFPFTSATDSATTGADGKPWVAYGGTGSLVVDHLGQMAPHQIAPSACCYYYPGLAVDGKSGETWIAYSSLILHHEGIFVQQLANSGAARGTDRLLPGSRTGGNTLVLDQRVGITGRGRGRSGVYVAYVSGYPSGLRIELLKIGSRQPVTLAAAGDEGHFAAATVTADAAGGLWTGWFDGDGSPAALFVRQSNDSVTKFGKTIRVGLPSGTSVIWKAYISAQGSGLTVVALLTRDGRTAYWATQVK